MDFLGIIPLPDKQRRVCDDSWFGVLPPCALSSLQRVEPQSWADSTLWHRVEVEQRNRQRSCILSQRRLARGLKAEWTSDLNIRPRHAPYGAAFISDHRSVEPCDHGEAVCIDTVLSFAAGLIWRRRSAGAAAGDQVRGKLDMDGLLFAGLDLFHKRFHGDLAFEIEVLGNRGEAGE